MHVLLISVLALALGLFAPREASAQFNGCAPGFCGSYSGALGCPAATAWLARTSGLSTTETNAYIRLICVDMIPNGIGCSAWSGSSGNDDAIYIFATNTTATANLNLCSSSYGVTVGAATVTFSGDHGYTGDGVTGYLDTNFNPTVGTPNFTLNAGFIAAYVLTNATSNVVLGQGTTSVAVYTYMDLGTTFQSPVNYASGTQGTSSETNAVGAWISNRSTASAQQAYKNGSSTPQWTDTTSNGGGPLYSNTFKILAATLGTSGAPSNFSGNQIAAVGIGGSKTGAQAAAWNNAINNYMTALALGINVY